MAFWDKFKDAGPVTNADVRPTPDRKSEWELEYAEHKAAVTEAEAKHFSPEKRAELMDRYRREHDEDVAAFRFSCHRHGDFLAIEVTRGEEKFATAVNLKDYADIRPITGSPPAEDALVSYYISHVSLDGTHNVASVPIGRAGPGWKLVAHPHREWQLGCDRIFETDAEARGTYTTNGFSNTALYRTTDAPRPARDDRIRFNGAGATLSVPHTLGQKVYEDILSALGSTP